MELVESEVKLSRKEKRKIKKQQELKEQAENENEIRISHIIKPVYFLALAIFLEMLNFLWIGFKVTGNPDKLQVLPKYFFLDLGFLLFFAAVIFLCRKRKLANFFMYFIIGLQFLINIINATLYKVFGDIFSFDMMKLGEEAVSAFKFEFIDFWSIIVNLALLGLLITAQVLLDRKFKKTVPLTSLNKKAILLLVFFGTWVVSLTCFFSQTLNFYDTDSSVKVSESDQYLWDNMHFKLEAYKKFGTWGFYIKSLANLIYKPDNFDENIENDIMLSLEEGQQELDVAAPLYGDNLIVIMLESFEWFAIDPFNTPTLWEIRTQTGVSMENYYSKNKTNVSEDIAILGNMPKDTSMQSLAKNGYLNTLYSLPNLFNQLGYTSNYFHSWKKGFYDRDIINAGMGFDNVYGLEDASLENKSTRFGDWNLDSQYIEYMLDKFIPSTGNFFSFFTTVATHGSYDTTNPRFSEYYQTYDANLEVYKQWLASETTYVYPTDSDLESYYRQYKCAAMDTDRLVALVIENLKEKGLYENTTLVLYADHNCYYEDIYFNIKGTSKADYHNIYNYNVPFMILSSKLAPEIKTDFVNTYDIYPTICELFGLPYNTALTQGYNIYSVEIENSVMVSYLSGAFNADFYTLNIVDMFASESATQEDLLRFKRNACKFYEKQYYIELIYKYGLAV